MHNQDTLAQWRERAQPKTVCQLAEAGLFVTTAQAWPDPMQPESWLIPPAASIPNRPPPKPDRRPSGMPTPKSGSTSPTIAAKPPTAPTTGSLKPCKAPASCPPA